MATTENGVELSSITHDVRGIVYKDEPQLAATIRIGSLVYTVEQDDELFGMNLDGEIMHSKGRIRLRPDMTREYEFMILWHEVLHGIMTHTGIDELLGEHEEKFIKVLAYGVADAIRNNSLLNWG